MKTQFHGTGKPNLIVYFAGWSTSPDLVKNWLLPPETDLLICYDYQDLQLDFDFSTYQTIRAVAWSMGVWVAERALQGVALQSATAINGTGLPCDDSFGIPCEIFAGTLNGLTPTTKAKFDRRICGDRANLQAYQAVENTRDFDNVRSELAVIFELVQQDKRTDLIRWTHAISGKNDKIFPISAQQKYWQKRTALYGTQWRELNGEHYLFSQFERWEQLWQLLKKA